MSQENPYDTPVAESVERRPPREQLLPPAIGLMVVTTLHMFGGFFFFAYVYQSGMAQDHRFNVIVYLISMLYCLVIMTGAFSMLRRGSYAWAMAVCILALVPLFGPCYVLGIPFGLWGIVVLRKPGVRDAFRTL